VSVRPKLHYTDTGYRHVVQNHQRTKICHIPTSWHVEMLGSGITMWQICCRIVAIELVRWRCSGVWLLSHKCDTHNTPKLWQVDALNSVLKVSITTRRCLFKSLDKQEWVSSGRIDAWIKVFYAKYLGPVVSVKHTFTSVSRDWLSVLRGFVLLQMANSVLLQMTNSMSTLADKTWSNLRLSYNSHKSNRGRF